MSSFDLGMLKECINSLHVESGADVEKLLQSKVVSDALEQMQMPMLCLACHIAKVRLVVSILERTTDVNVSGKDGMTPLHIVCDSEKSQHTHLKIATMLVSRGADLNARDTSGSTPLLLACHSNQTNMVEYLLTSGCDPNIPDCEGRTPFSMACQMATDQWYFWNTEYMDSMAGEETASSTENQDNDNTGALYPPDEDFPPVVICKLLLRAGAGADQGTLLPAALLYGTMDTVQGFLKLGMRVNMLDKNGRSPLGCACKSSHISAAMVRLLLEHGADISEASRGRNEKPIVLAYVFSFVEKMLLLLSYGATLSSEEMSELVSISITKLFLENPEVVHEESKELLPLKLLLKAGLRPDHSLITAKLNLVPLCSSFSTDQPWIYNLLSPMPSLSDICRVTIRSRLNPCIDTNIQFLPLPNALKSFLRFEDISAENGKS